MHQRRVSQDCGQPVNRKKLSSQFIARINEVNNSVFPFSPKLAPSSAKSVSPTVPISKIIQAKVANLKHKFGELDDMRRKLIERENFDSKQSTLSKSRTKSNDSSNENCLYDMSNHVSFFETYSNDRHESDLKNEKKAAQRAIFEKKVIEQESQEKIRSLSGQVSALEDRVKSLEQDLQVVLSKNAEKEKENNCLRASLESLQRSSEFLQRTVDKLNIELDSASSTLSSEMFKAWDSQVAIKYLETLQELHLADQFTISVINRLEKNETRKAVLSLTESKNEILKRAKKTNFNIEEFDKYISSFEFIYTRDTQKDLEQNDVFALMKCQALAVEDLLLISYNS